ncbi:hypothetical protein ACNHUS_18920 [Actinomycetes bacterium M1A6_2h]
MTEKLARAIELSYNAWPGARLSAMEYFSELGSDPVAQNRLGEMLDDDVIEVYVAAAEVLLTYSGKPGLELVFDELERRVEDPQIDYIWYKIGEVKAMHRPTLFAEAVAYADEKGSDVMKTIVQQLIADFNRMQDLPRNHVNPDGTSVGGR